jgi:hypothetical protein
MAVMLLDPLSAHLTGQASRRGLVPRVPTADRLLGDISAWLTSAYPDVVIGTRRTSTPTGQQLLHVGLHPVAPDVVIGATDTGATTIDAHTVTTGPGYHRFVARVAERIGVELGINWTTAVSDGDATRVGGMTFVDRPTTERSYLGWLGRELVGAQARRSAGLTGIHVGMPDRVTYTFDGAIATPLGPRDDAWLEAALADTRVATDITPWWPDATDARYLLDRALCLMWLEVRWRSPAIPEEGALLDEVHRLLTKAFPLDPSLPYPWQAWSEIVVARGLNDAMARQVLHRAGAGDPAAGTPIGYRRQPVTIHHEGWRLTVPGSFAERRTDEEWWGGGAGRRVTLAAVQTGTATGAMSPETFLGEYARDLGPDAIDHRAGSVLGRGRLQTDASSGVDIGILDAYSAVVGSGAAIRIEFDDPGDWQWALDMWRSLAPG